MNVKATPMVAIAMQHVPIQMAAFRVHVTVGSLEMASTAAVSDRTMFNLGTCNYRCLTC